MARGPQLQLFPGWVDHTRELSHEADLKLLAGLRRFPINQAFCHSIGEDY